METKVLHQVLNICLNKAKAEIVELRKYPFQVLSRRNILQKIVNHLIDRGNMIVLHYRYYVYIRV